MRIFVTGASGFIGSHLLPELQRGGHQVLGLARSDAAAATIESLGAIVHRGSLENLDSIRAGAKGADAVIHLGFVHDFSRFLESCQLDREVIDAIGTTLEPGKRLIVTSGVVAVSGGGEMSTERDLPPPSSAFPRSASDEAAEAASQRGIHVSIVCLPQVHDTQKQGLISYFTDIARAAGESAYVGDGSNRWAAAHVTDVARLYRLAVERENTEALMRYHAVDESGVPARAIAEAVGRRLNVPARSVSEGEASQRFGPLAMFASADRPSSSALTREWLGWQPSGPGLIDDIDAVREGAPV